MGDTDTQLLLDIGLPASMSRDDLIVTRSNRDAVMLVESWPDWPGTAVILAGPPGCGKTHLGAIWQESAGARKSHPARLGAADLDAAQGGVPILIDGIEPGSLDETALFHILNAARAQSGSVLMTSAYWPGGWRISTPDLRSRIKAATTVEIDEPDDELLVGVMAKLFSDRQIDVDAGVIRYIAGRIERSLASARDIVNSLDQASLERKSRITRTFASAFIREYDASQNEFEF